MCTEEPTGQFYCELQELACETDADCPGSLRCLENWGYDCPAGSGGSVAVAGAGGAIGTAGVAAPPPTVPEQDPGVGGMAGSGSACVQVLISKVCAPYDYFPPPGGMGSGGQTGGAGAGGAAGAGTTNPPTMNPGSGGASSAGAGGAGGTAAGEGGPANPDGGDDDDWLDHPRGRFGCAVAGNDASDALWSSLALLGFAALVLRRRARTMI
jgi:hypothetical protein